MAETVLGNVLEFFVRLGVYDIVLPFLLVFTIVFALFERTKVLGTEGKDKATKKNLNAIAAFSISFLVIASSKLVETITTVSSQVVILVLLGVFFLMLVGTFYSDDELSKGGLKDGWFKNIFITIMAVGIIGIFLDAIKTDGGRSWLDVTLDYLRNSWDSTVFASLVLIGLIIAFVYFLTKDDKKKEKKE
jgi:lysylphosphatidylglycerol synthetase-like protein (DUF2156 family)